MLESWESLPSFIAAATALGLAVSILLRPILATIRAPLMLALAATGAAQAAHGLSLQELDADLLWRRIALLGELGQAVATLFVGAALLASRGAPTGQAALPRARRLAWVAAGLGPLAFTELGLRRAPVTVQIGTVDAVTVGPLGVATLLYLLVVLMLSVGQIEQILRGLRDPARYRLKFILIGLATSAAYGIYEFSQFLLLPLWQSDMAEGSGLVTNLSMALLTYGFVRWGSGDVEGAFEPKPRAIFGSASFLVSSIYLVAIGVAGEVVAHAGRRLYFPVRTALVFSGLVALVLFVSSRHLRAELQRFVARHVHKAKYDYRQRWLEVTEAFSSAPTEAEILDRFLDLLAGTFAASRLSIWMRSHADGRFHQARSINTESPPPPVSGEHPVVARLAAATEAVSIESPDRSEGAAATPDPFLQATRAEIAMPIKGGTLLGFIVLGRDLRGAPYGSEDGELLRAIAHHVGVLLSHAHLAAESKAGAEMRALHQFSAFCIHDLKNLAARLSLVAQNARVHGQDPQFQASAMRTVDTTVERMSALIAKLSVAASAPREPSKEIGEPGTLQAALADACSVVKPGIRVAMPELGATPIRMKMEKEQLHQVFLNLVLNAQQALGDSGEIAIEVARRGDDQVIRIKDNGPGIPAAALPGLFLPFKSTKERGLGIGLYQCKDLVEGAGGRITVTSEPGAGTIVCVEIPGMPERDPASPNPSSSAPPPA